MLPFVPRLLDRAPPVVDRQVIALVTRSTAAAFRRDPPHLARLSRDQRLDAYARFTLLCAQDALERPDRGEAAQARLHRNAYRLAWLPGRLLRVRTASDAAALARFVYRALGIDFSGDARGQITISRCYFSDYYSPEVCRLMSAMDCGMLAGFSGHGTLHFTERITEGRPCCRAIFRAQTLSQEHPL